MANWGWYNFYTYIKLQPNVSIKSVESKIQAIYKRNNPNETNVLLHAAINQNSSRFKS